jgi:hypothetical protein
MCHNMSCNTTSVPYKLMQDRVTQAVTHVRWCSSMDLIALCYAQSNHIHIYRPSNFQRLHVIQPNQLSTANSNENLTVDDICWSTNGLLLAVASSRGNESKVIASAIDLIDLESGNVVFSIHDRPHVYQKLYWLNYEFDNRSDIEKLHKASVVSVLPLLELPDPGTIASGFSAVPFETRHHALLKPMSSFHILVALSTGQIAEFYAMGVMHIMSIELSSFLMFGERITNLKFANNFEQMLVFKENEDGIVNVCQIDLSHVFNTRSCEDIVSNYTQFIHCYDILCNDSSLKSSPSAKDQTILYQSSKIGQCIEYIQSQWDQLFNKQFVPLFNQLHNLMKQESLTSTTQINNQEFSSIFSTMMILGTVDHPTLQWLSVNATDQNLTKLLRQAQQTQKTLSIYLLDYIQRYLEHIILRFSSLSPSMNSELLKTSEALYTLAYQILNTFCNTIQGIEQFIEAIRHIQVKVCGKSKQRLMMQQMTQNTAPLPLKPVNMSKVIQFLKGEWLSDSCSPLLLQLKQQHQALGRLFEATFDRKAHALTSQVSHSLLTNILIPIPNYQVLCLKSYKPRNQMLLVGQLVEHPSNSGQYFQILRFNPANSSNIECIQIGVPDGFYVEWANFYGEDQLFCLVRREDTQIGDEESGNTNEASLFMITCSFADSSWRSLDETNTEIQDVSEMHILKQRAFMHEGTLQNVDIMDGKICLGCVIIDVQHTTSANTGNIQKRLCIFDMEEDEE